MHRNIQWIRIKVCRLKLFITSATLSHNLWVFAVWSSQSSATIGEDPIYDTTVCKNIAVDNGCLVESDVETAMVRFDSSQVSPPLYIRLPIHTNTYVARLTTGSVLTAFTRNTTCLGQLRFNR